MWDSAPALNRVCDVLFAAAALMALYGMVRFAIVQPVFAIRELRVVGAAERIQHTQVAALARRDVQGTFFTLDIVRLRNAFEKLPTRCCTIFTSSSIVEGTGKITVLNLLFKALDKSFTPLSRLFAVAITLNPLVA